ncbi:hypothetical protein CK203_068075 [Vitis vinifera]|uniref:Uncharacterized protein n=1 Tax=Vitis vinifera TaxID=29760 RepID=A0A438EW40_VITVI|nr:hypothetical protein CK203_068075 [Vitis vinifera]
MGYTAKTSLQSPQQKKTQNPISLKPPLNPSPVTLVASPTGTVVPVAELLRRDIQNSSQVGMMQWPWIVKLSQ